ncbi:MAG: hypothetical protein HWD85_08045 [Flavobacteriaceae bacterium]|nr:hypothetical protein [Flavobacteriaceae bacterium]
MKKKNTISLQTAKKWTKKWRKEEGTYNKHHKCRAFNIPKIDLQEVLAEDGVVSVRAYLGIDDNDVEKLVIVGVNAQGKDMISKKPTDLGDKEDDIYDFTRPCPDACDPDSPLNG